MINQKWNKCISERFFYNNAGTSIRQILVLNFRVWIITCNKRTVFQSRIVIRNIINYRPVIFFAIRCRHMAYALSIWVICCHSIRIRLQLCIRSIIIKRSQKSVKILFFTICIQRFRRNPFCFTEFRICVISTKCRPMMIRPKIFILRPMLHKHVIYVHVFYMFVHFCLNLLHGVMLIGRRDFVFQIIRKCNSRTEGNDKIIHIRFSGQSIRYLIYTFCIIVCYFVQICV